MYKKQTMLSQNKIKFIRSLDAKKNRQHHNCFVVEGEKMVLELLRSNFEIIELFILSDFLVNHDKQINKGVAVTEVSEMELKKISSLKTPNLALAITKIPDHKYDQHSYDSLSLALDNIQDPGNFGTLIRTANWFGVTTIFCSNDTVDAYNSKVVQSTMGAIFRTKIIYVDLLQTLIDAKKRGQIIYGTLLDGDNLYTVDLKNKGLIVLGNESNGISKAIQNLIDKKIRIPNFPEEVKTMESLNVGIANAIVLAEFRRQVSNFS